MAWQVLIILLFIRFSDLESNGRKKTFVYSSTDEHSRFLKETRSQTLHASGQKQFDLQESQAVPMINPNMKT
jgi:hypothetical protein